MGLESHLSNSGVITTTLEATVNWSRRNSIWPLLFGLACCAIEMIATAMTSPVSAANCSGARPGKLI